MIHIRVALARPGDFLVQLQEPAEGEWTVSGWLRTRGESVYHLGYWSDDVAATVAAYAEQDVSLGRMENEGLSPACAYLDTRATAGVFSELERR